jgi:hypothetical protein
MNRLPTTEEALHALERNSAAAAAFDVAAKVEAPGRTRREAVAAALEAIKARIEEHAAKRRLLATQRAKIRALEAAKAALPATRAKLATAKAAAAVRPSGRAVASATPTLDAFNRLTGDAAARFYRAHRLAIITEAEGRKFNP